MTSINPIDENAVLEELARQDAERPPTPTPVTQSDNANTPGVAEGAKISPSGVDETLLPPIKEDSASTRASAGGSGYIFSRIYLTAFLVFWIGGVAMSAPPFRALAMDTQNSIAMMFIFMGVMALAGLFITALVGIINDSVTKRAAGRTGTSIANITLWPALIFIVAQLLNSLLSAI